MVASRLVHALLVLARMNTKWLAMLTLMGIGCGEASTRQDAVDMQQPSKPVDSRQALRDATIFKNPSFEQLGPGNTALDWSCLCPDASGQYAQSQCKTVTGGAVHGEHALLVPAGCSASQTVAAFDRTRGIRYDFFAADAAVYPQSAIVMVNDAQGALTDSGMSPGLWDRRSDWRSEASLGAVSTASGAHATFWIDNALGLVDMRIDDITAVQDVPNPDPKRGSLLRADHYETVSYAAGNEPTSFYTPLPIDYASQVPLYVELTVKPESVVDHIAYSQRDEGNWGATVSLRPGGSADEVSIAWQAVVLTRELTDEERPSVFAAKRTPSDWLAASPIADATYAPIAQNAQSFKLAATASPLERLSALLQFTSSYPTNLTTLMALDASSVWNTRDASCTGYANLASATGRALGLPTRHVTNILVGEAQQMHSITEAYLGADQGWRRVEPQGTSTRVPEDYGLIMTLVVPEDEGPDALADRPWALAGVPRREFTEPVTGGSRLAPTANDHFIDCVGCLNRADRQAFLREDATAIHDSFDRARARWASDRAAFLAGGLDTSTMTARRHLLDARTLADIDAALAQP
jgi:transglutaminase-like putative cysteine protease